MLSRPHGIHILTPLVVPGGYVRTDKFHADLLFNGDEGVVILPIIAASLRSVSVPKMQEKKKFRGRCTSGAWLR